MRVDELDRYVLTLPFLSLPAKKLVPTLSIAYVYILILESK